MSVAMQIGHPSSSLDQGGEVGAEKWKHRSSWIACLPENSEKLICRFSFVYMFFIYVFLPRQFTNQEAFVSRENLQVNNTSFWTSPWACFSKVPRTVRARKASYQTEMRLPWKADLLTCL